MEMMMMMMIKEMDMERVEADGEEEDAQREYEELVADSTVVTGSATGSWIIRSLLSWL